MTRFLFALVVAAWLGTPAAAQLSIFDDFLGSAVDKHAWFVDDSRSALTVSGGRLKAAVVGVANTENRAALTAYDRLQGPFDLILDFDNFASSGLTRAGLEIWVRDQSVALTNAGGMNIEIAAGIANGKAWKTFGTWAESGGSLTGTSTPTTATAGQLRLTRSATAILACYRVKGQTNWVVLKTWANTRSDVVSVRVSAWGGESGKTNSGTFRVECDKLSFQGRRVVGSRGFGKSCFDVRHFAYGLPAIGNAHHMLELAAPLTFTGGATLFAVGLYPQNIDLGFAGAPGCALNTHTLFVLPAPLLNTRGETRLGLPIPNNPSFVGTTFYSQGAVSTAVNLFGLALSEGVSHKILKL